MRSIIEKVYLRLKEYKFKTIIENLNEVNIDNITENITKNCWNYNIQYKVILKTADCLIIKLIGMEKITLLKYHKKEKVLLWEYKSFLEYLEQHNVDTGVYITTGSFEKRINRYTNKKSNIKIYKVDGYKFIKKQVSIKQLNFLEYLP